MCPAQTSVPQGALGSPVREGVAPKCQVHSCGQPDPQEGVESLSGLGNLGCVPILSPTSWVTWGKSPHLLGFCFYLVY